MFFFHYDVYLLFSFINDGRAISVSDGLFHGVDPSAKNLTNDPVIRLQVINRIRAIYLNPEQTVNEQTRSIKENPIFDEAACIKRWCVLNHENEYWEPLIRVFKKILKKHCK